MPPKRKVVKVADTPEPDMHNGGGSGGLSKGDRDLIITTSVLFGGGGALGVYYKFINKETLKNSINSLRKWIKDAREMKGEVDELKRDLGFRKKDYDALSKALEDVGHNYLIDIGESSIRYFNIAEKQIKTVTFAGKIHPNVAKALTNSIKTNMATLLHARGEMIGEDAEFDFEYAHRIFVREIDRRHGLETFLQSIKDPRIGDDARRKALVKVRNIITDLERSPEYGAQMKEYFREYKDTDVLDKIAIKDNAKNFKSNDILNDLAEFIESSGVHPLKKGERLAVLMHGDFESMLAFHI